MTQHKFSSVICPAAFATLFFGLSNTLCFANEPVELDQLIVTAAMQPINEKDAAGSVTVITREQIEQKQARYLSDLLREIPGFAVSQSGGAGKQTQLRVRGAEANHMLVLFDGSRVNDPASSDEFQYQYALTSDIERIEIVTGPQSAIWGSDALAGVINIIRKRAHQESGFSVSAEAGSFQTRSVMANATAGGERYSLWAGLARETTDGTNIARSGSETDASENTSANARFELSVSDSIRLGVSGSSVAAQSQFDDIDYLVTGLPADADRLTESSTQSWQGDLSIQPPSGNWSAGITGSYLDTDNQNFSDGLWTDSTAAQTLEFSVSASVMLDAQRTGSHKISMAANHRQVDFSQRGLASFYGDPNQDQDYDLKGLAIEYQGKPGEVFSWTMSARRDTFSAFDDVSTWQMGVSRRLTDYLRIRGSVGTGSKTPTFTELFGFFPGTFAGNPNLRPETSTGWELGLDAALAENRLKLELVYFDQELDDEIDGFVFDPDAGLFTAINKPYASSREGFEASLTAAMSQALDLALNFSHLRSEEVNFAGQPVPEVRRPENTYNLSANYRLPDDRGNLNLNINHTGAQLDVFFSPESFVSQQIQLPAYTVVNLAASWRVRESIELVARANNLLDENYEEVLGFVRPGRSIYIGFRGRFEF